MKVLAFRHVPFEDLGHIAPALEEYGLGIEYADLYRGASGAPDASAYGGLIFMGGPMSVNDSLPYITTELRIIEDAARRKQPMLGVCLGSQLIAKALGARVYRNPVKEIGWFDVDFAAEAAGDPLFRAAQPRELVFHWHGETFDMPSGAQHLASSARCRHQAFRYGDAIYGLQFHLEVTPPMIADWCEQDANCGDVRELTEIPDPHRNAVRLGDLSRSVFGNWGQLLSNSQWHAGKA